MVSRLAPMTAGWMDTPKSMAIHLAVTLAGQTLMGDQMDVRLARQIWMESLKAEWMAIRLAATWASQTLMGDRRDVSLARWTWLEYLKAELMGEAWAGRRL